MIDKTTGLEHAVEASVEPGMTVHLTTQSRAATRAIQRVFRGRDMRLTLVMCRVGGGNAADLVASGLVRHVIAGSYGAVSSQYTGRYPQVGRVHESGAVTFQHWSFLSLTQRLMAGAQGLPYALTHSLRGSGMAAANTGDYALVPSPWDADALVGAVSAIRPDVSFVHVPACDLEGNAVMVPPLEDGAWGALSSRGGAVVTTEHVITADELRAHSHLVRLPSMHVRHVCEVPFGAHPGPFGSTLTPEFRRYQEDSDFYGRYFAAVRGRGDESLDDWVAEWIEAPSHEAYLDKLGAERQESLDDRRRRVTTLAAVDRTPPRGGAERSSAVGTKPTDTEQLMTLAFRCVVAKVEQEGPTVLLVGVGLSEVPATAAYEHLSDLELDLTLAMGHGFFGFEPTPGRSEPDPATSLMTTDTMGVYGTLLGGPARPGLALLGVAQVDRLGNLNSTLVDGRLLTGSGGSNDAASICETIVVTRLEPGRLVDTVEFVTCPGDNVSTVVTELCVFEKRGGELVVTTYVAPEDTPVDDALAEISRRCGWTVTATADARRADPPSPTELELIRRYMPPRYRRGADQPDRAGGAT